MVMPLKIIRFGGRIPYTGRFGGLIFGFVPGRAGVHAGPRGFFAVWN
jgi:hypothetical protein